MPLLTANGLSKYYQGNAVLSRVGFGLETGERVGLVGANGSGKTTLLRLIVGAETADEGALERQRNLRPGYLPQEAPELADVALWDSMLEVFEPLLELERSLAELAESLAADKDSPELLARYSRAQDEFEHGGGYTYEARIKAVLGGLGFTPDQFDHPLGRFSGGWRTRALLARLLLEEPELLLLDEPTNNLDLNAVRWLEQFLIDYRGSILVVSHDRFLLDKVCNRVWALTHGVLECYKGNYTAYRTQSKARYEQRLKQWEAQQDHIAKEEDFIRRHLAGQRTREAQGRRTKLARFLERDAIAKPLLLRGFQMHMTAARRTGDLVLETTDLSLGYDEDHCLCRLPNLRLERGQSLAVLGPNGCGKTTLLRTLMGQIEPLSGAMRFGANVDLGYLSQTREDLDPQLTVLDCLRQVQEKPDDAQARHLLGAWLFSGDDVFKQVADLSGGERARLALARLSVLEPNLLLLDEPTNHLDIPAMEALQQMLLAYRGTIIMVSHDRYCVQALVPRLLVIEDDGARFFDGTWEDYAGSSAPPPAAPEVAGKRPPSTPRERHREARRQQNRLQRQRQRHDELEAQLHELEDEKRMLEHAVGKAGEERDLDQIEALTAQLEAVTAQLEKLWTEWAALADELE